MIVVDASVVVSGLLDDGPVGERARTAVRADPHLAAPELLMFEVLSALRGLERSGRVSGVDVDRALDRAARLRVRPVPTTLLVDRVWQLRHNLTTYDAAYVAAAEATGAPLVTADRAMARASDVRCEVRVITD